MTDDWRILRRWKQGVLRKGGILVQSGLMKKSLMEKSIVHALDSGYLGRPQFDAVYLIDVGGRGEVFALIDNATAPCLERLLHAMAALGVTAGDPRLKALIVTHVHLDHAGATGQLAQLFKHAQVICHPKTARHLADPSRLVRSVKLVYGAAEFEKLYGELLPVPSEKIQMAEEGFCQKWGNHTFEYWHLLGHATHHIGILEVESKVFFSGDSFGLRYPALQVDLKRNLKRPFIFPSTSPTDFNPGQAIESIKRIAKSVKDGRIESVYLTHFGALEGEEEIITAAEDLVRHLEFSRGLMDGRSANDCTRALKIYYQKEFEALGGVWDRDVESLLELDLKLNGQGIEFAAGKR